MEKARVSFNCVEMGASPYLIYDHFLMYRQSVIRCKECRVDYAGKVSILRHNFHLQYPVAKKTMLK